MDGSGPLALTGTDGTSVWRGRRVPETPVVSVSIPVVSDHGLIHGCLDSIAESSPSVDTEVVVVANGLGGDELAPLQQRDDIVLVRSAVNAGFSGGNNLAARFARGRYLLLLNDDSLVEAGFIDRLLSAFERDPSIAAAGGTILSADGTLLEAGSVLWNDGWAAHVGADLPPGSTAYHYVRYVDYTSANGLMVDRRAWDAVGGLDERYFPAYYEDVDFCLALWDLGYKVAYEPRARLRHLESQSTSASFRNFLLIRNRALLAAKWSVLLQNFADHPERIDEAAIDAAVLRSERSRGRVLVLEASADAKEWRSLPTVAALASAGWSVMLSVPRGASSTGGAAHRPVPDRMVDAGVDVREEPPEELITKYGDDLEAVVVSDDGPDVEPLLERPDGRTIPLVAPGEDGDDAVVIRVASAVRGGGNSSIVVDAQLPEMRVANGGPTREALDSFGGVADGSPVGATTDDDFRRALEFAEADVRVRREYAESLESEIRHLRAVADETDAAFQRLVESFDEKERYIDSLLSVRVKKWIAGRLTNRGS